MSKFIARYAPAIAAFGVLTSSSFGVNAQSEGRAAEMPSVTVSYADLDLNTPAGVDALYSRLRSAAQEVCNVRERHALAQAVESRTCYRRALDDALDQVTALTPDVPHGAAHTGDDLN